jgi:hypothetical protein
MFAVGVQINFWVSHFKPNQTYPKARPLTVILNHPLTVKNFKYQVNHRL